jgi:hypothetical protein
VDENGLKVSAHGANKGEFALAGTTALAGHVQDPDGIDSAFNCGMLAIITPADTHPGGQIGFQP